MVMLRSLVGIFILLFVASCSESDKERFARLVGEWERKEIRFPDHSVFTVQGRDTVDFEFRNAGYKVVTYVDSAGCTSCKLQLPRWKDLISEVDSLTDGSVPFLFYFHPKDLEELKYLTRREGFVYPVCFDEKDDFNRLNRFPGEMMFQTFLLDKENEVVVIGNPVLSPQVKELYLKVLTGQVDATPKGTVTQMSVDRTVLDFGTFPKEEKQQRSFVLTNTGDNLLVVHDVVTSCGCTKVEYDKRPVRPGGTLELKVTYEAEKPGHFSKSLRVYSNTEDSPLRLSVRGTAK